MTYILCQVLQGSVNISRVVNSTTAGEYFFWFNMTAAHLNIHPRGRWLVT